MGDLFDLGDYRDQKEREEIEELQEKLKEHIENQPPPSHGGYYSSLEEMLEREGYDFFISVDAEPEEPRRPTRWHHFKKSVYHIWRTIRGEKSEGDVQDR